MTKWIEGLKGKMGEFWWWSLLGFLACRSGDLIQAFIGLWLVPHYVPTEELGAVLPLLRLSGFWGLPLTVILYPLAKFLNVYLTKGEFGKVRTLLRTVMIFGAVMAAAVFLVARLVLPLFFERIRVADGSLGVMTVIAGMVGALAPVYVSALQGLKKFRASTVLSALGAPFRLITLLVLMPIRALTGYIVGTMVYPLVQIVGSFFALRKELGGEVRCVAIGREDWMRMMRYTAPVMFNIVAGTACATCMAMLIRQRLPEFDSAAYYIISRLAEMASYAGMSLVYVAFPLAAENRTRGVEDPKLLRNLLLGSLVPGLILSAVFAVAGRWMFGLVDLWRPYSGCVPHLVLCTLNVSASTTIIGFIAYETASERFRWIYFIIPLTVIEVVGLALLAGFGVLEATGCLTLTFFLWWMLAFSLLRIVCAAVHVGRVRKGMIA